MDTADPIRPAGPPGVPYNQSIEHCFADSIGPSGLSESSFAPYRDRADAALERLRADYAGGRLAFLSLAEQRDDLVDLAILAADFCQGLDDILILGTGGSSLGGRALYALQDALLGRSDSPVRLHFMSSIDPDVWEAVFERIDPARSGIIAVSKSGSTAETVAQFLSILPFFESAGGEALSDRVLVVTEPRDNPLHRIAQDRGFKVLDHPLEVGGRFSVLSIVGVLPMLLAGLDPRALRGGAWDVLRQTLAAKTAAASPPAMAAALLIALQKEKGITQHVLMPYNDRLGPFSEWYRQLWAESLGKDGQGITPIRGMGAVDQHSQLQLYLDGPGDKAFTLLFADTAGKGERINPGLCQDPEIAYLADRTMGDLLKAEARATFSALVGKGRPIRSIEVGPLDARCLGGLFMHFFLETVIAADLMGVDPQGQPAVEEGKRLARQYLGEDSP